MILHIADKLNTYLGMLTEYQVWVKEAQYTSVIGRYHPFLTLGVPMQAHSFISMSPLALVTLIENCQERDHGSPLGLDWQMIYLSLLAEWIVG